MIGSDGVAVALDGDDDAATGECVSGFDVDVDAVVVAAGCLVGGVAHGLGEFGDEAFEFVGVDDGKVERSFRGCSAGAGGDRGYVTGFVEGACEAAQAGGRVYGAQIGVGEAARVGDHGGATGSVGAAGGGVDGCFPSVDHQGQGVRGVRRLRRCRRRRGLEPVATR